MEKKESLTKKKGRSTECTVRAHIGKYVHKHQDKSQKENMP